MRGADGGPWNRLCALPAFWVGLLYDQSALDAAWDVVKHWTAEDHAFLRREVPRAALNTQFKGKPLSALAIQVLEIARAGLTARRRLDAGASDETGFLHVLDQIAETGETPAEQKLALYHGRWNGDVTPIFKEFAY
jgi:glutamate--cysteine ligase